VSQTWDKFIVLSEELKNIFSKHADLVADGRDWHEDHINYFFKNHMLEMGHISIIDRRETHGMWMMHVNTYTNEKYPMPVYGFDVICGKKKVTGCFHDMSPTTPNHPVVKQYEDTVRGFVPVRTRPLPDWAKEIFTESMVAAGNVKDEVEIDRLVDFGIRNLKNWFEYASTLEPTDDVELSKQHNAGKAKYCHNQLMNDNSKNVMVALGLGEDYVKRFKGIQFPYV
jgi:hypothetical protein